MAVVEHTEKLFPGGALENIAAKSVMREAIHLNLVFSFETWERRNQLKFGSVAFLLLGTLLAPTPLSRRLVQVTNIILDETKKHAVFLYGSLHSTLWSLQTLPTDSLLNKRITWKFREFLQNKLWQTLSTDSLLNKCITRKFRKSLQNKLWQNVDFVNSRERPLAWACALRSRNYHPCFAVCH